MAIVLYLDENVSQRLIEALRPLGIDAVSSNQFLKGGTNAEQLLVAQRLGRVLVTTNTDDFLLLHQAWRTWGAEWLGHARPRHAGIILLHSSPGLGVAHVAQLLFDRAGRLIDMGAFQDRLFIWNNQIGWHERWPNWVCEMP